VDVFVKRETVVEAGASAPLHKHPQLEVRVAFFGNQVAHFFSSRVSEDERRWEGFEIDLFSCCTHGGLLGCRPAKLAVCKHNSRLSSYSTATRREFQPCWG